jgi:hypothetical protein
MIGSNTGSTELMCPAVIVEWETAQAHSPERAAACLRAVCRQLRVLQTRMQGRPELVITYSPQHDDAAAIQSIVEHAGEPCGWPAHVTVAPVPFGTDYYGHKNFGFSLTSNDAIVFLDSDLIPDEGWLEGMLTPLRDFRVPIVVGNTYMDTSSLYAKCVALFWIFDTRATAPGIAKTARLVSNSIAFRRALFARFPFPQRPTFRGQCSELALILRRQGIGLYLNCAAQSAHPPPNGIARFIERALFAGHDECTYRRLTGSAHAGHAIARFGTDLRTVCRRIGERRHAIAAGGGAAIAGACLGFAYYSLKLGGYLLTLASPTAVRRMFAA